MLSVGIPGTTELLIISGIAFLIFGAKRMPELARSVGKSVIEFKRGFKDVEETVEETKDLANSALSDVNKEIKDVKNA